MNRLRTATMIVILLPAFVTLPGCGSSGGGGDDGVNTQPVVQERAAVAMSLSGGSETVGSVEVTLDLPEGFVPATDSDSSLASGSVVTHLSSSYVDGLYGSGGVRLGVISGRGFTSQEFCALYKDLADGESLPSADDFTVTDLRVTDPNGVEMAGYDLVLTVERQ